MTFRRPAVILMAVALDLASSASRPRAPIPSPGWAARSTGRSAVRPAAEWPTARWP